jgi:hypothetical protein
MPTLRAYCFVVGSTSAADPYIWLFRLFIIYSAFFLFLSPSGLTTLYGAMHEGKTPAPHIFSFGFLAILFSSATCLPFPGWIILFWAALRISLYIYILLSVTCLLVNYFPSTLLHGPIKQTPWPESASKLYRLSDICLLAKLVPTFADKWCHMVRVTDPYDRILGSPDWSRYFFFQVAPQLYSRGWVDPVPDPLLLRKSGSAGNRNRASGSVARNSDQYTRVGHMAQLH